MVELLIVIGIFLVYGIVSLIGAYRYGNGPWG